MCDEAYRRKALPYVAIGVIAAYGNMAGYEPYRHVVDYSVKDTVIQTYAGEVSAGPFYSFRTDCAITTVG